MARVLLVDDDPDVLESIGDWLRRKHEVAVALGLPHALLLLQDGLVPDVLVTDLDMPPFSGEDLLAVVAARYPSVCRVLHTGASGEKIGPTHAQHVLLKGDDLDQLERIISRCGTARRSAI